MFPASTVSNAGENENLTSMDGPLYKKAWYNNSTWYCYMTGENNLKRQSGKHPFSLLMLEFSNRTVCN